MEELTSTLPSDKFTDHPYGWPQRLPAAERGVEAVEATVADAVSGQVQSGDTGRSFHAVEGIVEAGVVGEIDLVVRAQIAEELHTVAAEDDAGRVVQGLHGQAEILELLQTESRIIGLRQENRNLTEVSDLAEHAQIVGAAGIENLVVELDRTRVLADLAGDDVDIVSGRMDLAGIELLHDRSQGDFLTRGVAQTEDALHARDTVAALGDVEGEDRLFAGGIHGFFRLESGFSIHRGASAGVRIDVEDEVADVHGFLAVDHEIRLAPVAMRDESLRGDRDGRREEDHGRDLGDDGRDVNDRTNRLGRLTVGAVRHLVLDADELGVAGDREQDHVGLGGDVETLGHRAVLKREAHEEADVVALGEPERRDAADVVAIGVRLGADDQRDLAIVDHEAGLVESAVVLVDHSHDGVQDGGGHDAGVVVRGFVDDEALQDADAVHAGMLRESRDHFVSAVGDRTFGDAGGAREDQRDAVVGFFVIDDLSVHGAGDDGFDAESETVALFVQIFDVLAAGSTGHGSQNGRLLALDERFAGGNFALILPVGGRRVHGSGLRLRCCIGTGVDFDSHREFSLVGCEGS